ncbi:MAG: hypothetical protein I8H71_01170 [Xanthomonadaceae bacterium]|nr:hypothetical protein [Xanthomonadaceae bacterium]
MLIHAFRRKESIPVELFGTVIHFVPNESGHVVADVDHEPSVGRLLSIRDAYREYNREGSAATPGAPVQSLVLARPESLQDEIEVGEDAFVSGDAVLQSAFEAADMSIEAWNALAGADRDALIRVEIDRMLSAVKRTDEDDEAEAQREEEEQRARIAAAEREKAEASANKDAQTPAAPADPLVLVNDDGQTLDIGKLTAKQVRAMAAEQSPPISLPAGNSTPIGELRLLLAKGLKGEE